MSEILSDAAFDLLRAVLFVLGAGFFLYGGLAVFLPLPVILWEMVGDVPMFVWEYLAWAYGVSV